MTYVKRKDARFVVDFHGVIHRVHVRVVLAREPIAAQRVPLRREGRWVVHLCE